MSEVEKFLTNPHLEKIGSSEIRVIDEKPIEKIASTESNKVGEPRHPDFEKIYRQFMKRYCGSEDNECERGKRVYYAWLNKMGLDDTKPYRKPQEAFNWADSVLRFAKEDEENKYYKVEALFPVSSMNRNVYTEDELIRAARTLIGKPVNVNHESPPIAGVEIVDAEYEDRAVEVLLKIPRAAEFEGRKIVDMIDGGEIMHVSIEASCRNIQPVPVDGELGRKCEGLVFTGLALLTKDVLPGVPLTRIEPVEKIVENFTVTEENEKMNEEDKFGPRSDEDRAKAHFGISDEEWDKLSDDEKKALIAKLPPRGTAGKKEAENKSNEDNKEEHGEVDEEVKRVIEEIDKLIKERGIEEREWDTAFINSLPDAAFAVIEPAYQRGETEDKRCRHLPHHGPDVKNPNEHETVDLPHLRNALARCNQIKPVTDSISAEELRRRAREHLLRHAKALLPSYQEQNEPEKPEEEKKSPCETAKESLLKRLKEVEQKVQAFEDALNALSETVNEIKQAKEVSEAVTEKEETPKILTKEGFWERFRELRREGLSKSDAFRLVSLEVLKALHKSK